MLGSTSAQFLEIGGPLASRTSGSTTSGALDVGTTAASEPFVEPPLLRGPGNEFAVAGDRSAAVAGDRFADDRVDGRVPESVARIVTQLAPIGSVPALLSSYEREANRADPDVRSAYAQAWMTLVIGGARSTTRRARIRRTHVPSHRPR